jgi:hypothetical protein
LLARPSSEAIAASIAISDFLAYALVEFYQAKVYEHDGKKADAVNAYH